MATNTTPNGLVELQTKVSKTVLVASTILFLVIFVNDFLLGLYAIALLKIGMAGVCLWALYKLKRLGFQERVAHLVFLPLILFMVLNYLNNQGLDGPTILGTLGLFISYQIILGRKWSLIYTIGTLVLFLVLIYVGMDKQNLMIPEYSSDMNRFLDHAATYIVMVVYSTVLVGMVLKVYRKQNEQLQESQKALEAEIKQVESEKSHKAYLLGVLAHDVRNPVHNLKQLIELYHEKLVSKAEFSFLMSDLDSRVNDLQHTVEGILRDIKVDITRPDDDPILVNPITFTQELMGNMAGKFKAKHQTLLFDHPETVSSHLQIGRNASEVSIVLRNLLDNASKYSPEGSDIQVYLRDGDGTLQWDVQDAGAGVPAEIQPYLFRHNVPSQHGSGVGLYLCKSISESIRADLSYIPQPTGSLFRLTVAIAATAN